MAAHRKPGDEREEDVLARQVHIEKHIENAFRAEAARLKEGIKEIEEKVSGHGYLTAGMEYALNVIEWAIGLLKGEGDANIHGSTKHADVSED